MCVQASQWPAILCDTHSRRLQCQHIAVRFTETSVPQVVPKFRSQDFSTIVRDTLILCVFMRLNGRLPYVAQFLKDYDADN
jgi:hypothetical protein